MAGTCFRQVRVLDPQSPFHLERVNIHIDEGGIITFVGEQEISQEEKVIDWPDREVYLSPGWMDMEVHLNTPGFEYKENLHQLAQAAIRGGFTHLLCYPNTNPPVDHAETLRSLQHQAAHFPCQISFAASLSENNQGKELAELYEMYRSGARAFTEGTRGPIEEGLLSRSLRYLKAFNGLILTYPLLSSLAKEGEINEGPVSLQLGMPPLPQAAETAALLRDLEILAYEEGRIHFQPLSSPAVMDLLAKSKRQGHAVSMGMPAYYLAFSDEQLLDFDTNLKVFPPLRSKKQIQALIQHIREGNVDVITSGHRAQGLEEKRLEFGLAEAGMLNLQTFMPVLNVELIQKGHLDWSALIELIAINPRKLLGIEVPGINVGKKAELTAFDPDLQWVLEKDDIPSTAKNSPFIGKSLRGKSVGIWIDGHWHPTN